MSGARPITRAIQEVRTLAEELKLAHTINGRWPAEEADARIEYIRLRAVAELAEKEFNDLRQKELRLSQIEVEPITTWEKFVQ